MSTEKNYEGLTDDEIAELKAAEGEAESTDDTGEDDATANAEADAAAAAEAKAKEDADAAAKAAAEAGAGKTEEVPSADRATEVAPPLRAQAPANIDEAMKAIAADEEALTAKFDDGEITAKEFGASLRELSERREAVRWDQRKAELASEMTEQAQVNAWNADVREFMTTTGAHLTKSNAALLGFDAHVKAVTGDPSNAALSNKAMLDKAYKLYTAEINEAFGIKPDTKPAPKADGNPPAKKREIPPSLAHVPAAEVEATDGGKFASLDRLASSDPEAYERAIAKMGSAELEEYANASTAA